MRKEVLFAIVAGVIFGIVLTFGIWRANSSIKVKENSQEVSPTPTPSPSQPIGTLVVSLARPENLDVITQSPVEMTGITQASAWVVISAEAKDYYLKADAAGAFGELVELTAGINQIKITAIEENGERDEELINLVYSTEFSK